MVVGITSVGITSVGITSAGITLMGITSVDITRETKYRREVTQKYWQEYFFL